MQRKHSIKVRQTFLKMLDLYLVVMGGILFYRFL